MQQTRTEKGSISIFFVRSALAPVIEQGFDADELLRNAGISPSLLQTPQARVTPQNFSALWLAVAHTLNDELFAQDSRRMKVGSFAMLCQALVHSSTLKSALHRMTRIFNLILDDFHCSVETGAQHASLNITHTPGRRTSPVLGCETLLMMQHGLACWLIGRRIPILAAGFCYPEPEHSAEYARMYSHQLRFDQPMTSLTFDASYLDLPVVQNQKTVVDFVRQAPANIIVKYKNSAGLAAQIRRRLRAAARTEWPDFEEFAALLNMTPSTLRRRLQEEGQSFQGIKDQLRRDMAIDYLCHTANSVTDIACELGFSEASAFHRAFKKWTGANPGEYRERMLHG
ncbi:AraC family transcriptional regulator [Noviherbaspirillum sedimenti]|uniref:AraC family transcriptional regulator n=1 Tax=Noviherbaspirillum sedimenti TaxID=2320865 RepID=A0A3A3G4H6_9BURK|nr:AraC family transcriptional regulator [Noviherbaspirillum sedimenti]RJG03387.1 AraC family transcriptional regulator [Noviherbaspirillum sedimenti]